MLFHWLMTFAICRAATLRPHQELMHVSEHFEPVFEFKRETCDLRLQTYLVE